MNVCEEQADLYALHVKCSLESGHKGLHHDKALNVRWPTDSRSKQ